MIAELETQPPADFVLKVNEVFHDLEGEQYMLRHPEIMDAELQRWHRIARTVLPDKRTSRVILDIGSGTGFVPLQLMPRLQPADRLICSDISARMLDVCRGQLAAAGVPCDSTYVKLDGKTLPRIPEGCDIVTLNSVLHHVPDVAAFLREVDALVRPGGALVIGHEPNRRFAVSKVMRRAFRLATRFAGFQPKFGARMASVMRRFKITPPAGRRSEPAARQGHADYSSFNVVLNGKLLEMGLIERPLSMEEVWEITDLHEHWRPRTSRHDSGRGFDVSDLRCKYLPDYRIEFFESYSHLSILSRSNTWMRLGDGLLRLLFPSHGATFSVVFRKQPKRGTDGRPQAGTIVQ